MLDMEVSESERRVRFDIPIEVGESINYIQLGRRKSIPFGRERSKPAKILKQKGESNLCYIIYR